MSNNTALNLLILIGAVIIQQAIGARHCSSYCDENNNLVAARTCGSSKRPFCCGNETYRYCCDDQGLDITDLYDDMCGCPDMACTHFGWNLIAVVIGVALLVLVVMICACNILASCDCCNLQVSLLNGRSARVGSRDLPTVSRQVNGHENLPPSHTVVLTPPDYDLVCADLPKYEEIYDEGQTQADQPASNGLVNPAFISDEDVQPNSRNNITRINVRSSEDLSLGPQQSNPDTTSRDGSPPPPYVN